jgi:hypothetical protein
MTADDEAGTIAAATVFDIGQARTENFSSLAQNSGIIC